MATSNPPQESAEEKSTPHADVDNAFGFLPIEWIRDPETSTEELCILAYRCTFGDDKKPFGLREAALSNTPILRRSGFGENKRARGIAAAVRKKRLIRPLATNPVDHLNLPENLTPLNSVCVRRGWFNNKIKRGAMTANTALSCDEMAFMLFLLAGTGNGPRTYRRELEARFQLSRGTVRKVLKALRQRGIVEMHQGRDENDFDGVTYSVRRFEPANRLPTAPAPARDTLESSGDGRPDFAPGQFGGDQFGGDRFEGDIRSSPSTDLYSPNAQLMPSAPDGGEGGAREGELLWQAARNEHCLAGWMADLDLDPYSIYPVEEDVELIRAAMPEQELLDWLREATGSNAASHITSRAGIEVIRRLAAKILETGMAAEISKSLEPRIAVGLVLQAIWDRIGSRGESMTSFEIAGSRILHGLYDGRSDTAFFKANADRKFLNLVAEASIAHAAMSLLANDTLDLWHDPERNFRKELAESVGWCLERFGLLAVDAMLAEIERLKLTGCIGKMGGYEIGDALAGSLQSTQMGERCHEAGTS